MDFAEYVRKISFRFLQPTTPRPVGLRGVAKLLRSFGVHLEVMNTRLPMDEHAMRNRLREVCRVPRMSTFAVGAMINQAVAQLPQGQAYLNVGVWNGFTFLAGLVDNSGKRCIGIDNFSHNNSPRAAFLERFEHFRGENHSFIEADYRMYFEQIHQEPIGFYVLDGPHAYSHQLDGLKLAEPFFAQDCVVMVDDTNWDQVRQANLDFISNSPNKYRMLLDVCTPNNGHPTFWNGEMVFQLDGQNVLPKPRVLAARAA
jgi:Methyltransferase domain